MTNNKPENNAHGEERRSVRMGDKEKQKEYKAFKRAVITFPYSDTEELNNEHEFVFAWFWKRYAKIRLDANIYRKYH